MKFLPHVDPNHYLKLMFCKLKLVSWTIPPSRSVLYFPPQNTWGLFKTRGQEFFNWAWIRSYQADSSSVNAGLGSF